MDQSQWASTSSPSSKEGGKAKAKPQISSLSASTPSFSPANASAPSSESLTDAVAKTGASQHDLLDDTIPVDGSVRVRSEDDLFADDFTPAEQTVVEQPAIEQPVIQPVTLPFYRRGTRQRGGGRRGVRGRGTFARQHASQPNGDASRQQTADPDSTNETAVSRGEGDGSAAQKGNFAANRNDRQIVGGVRKPKLTEDELAEKMARIQVKNASLTAAYARAEADAASFAQREEKAKQLAAQRQTQERRERQQMIGEREKNRMRKLKAMEGREWDAEKNEDDFRKNGKFDKKGAFTGDAQEQDDGRQYLYREPRGGRGRNEGGKAAAAIKEQKQPRSEDFPALPAINKLTTETIVNTSAGGDSWADQVESTRVTK